MANGARRSHVSVTRSADSTRDDAMRCPPHPGRMRVRVLMQQTRLILRVSNGAQARRAVRTPICRGPKVRRNSDMRTRTLRHEANSSVWVSRRTKSVACGLS